LLRSLATDFLREFQAFEVNRVVDVVRQVAESFVERRNNYRVLPV
jgi:hypothetical protein